jgi:hypothetical protein
MREKEIINSVAVISKNGRKLMPTNRFRHIRHMLKDGRAVIYSRKPFAIQLTYDSKEFVQ